MTNDELKACIVSKEVELNNEDGFCTKLKELSAKADEINKIMDDSIQLVDKQSECDYADDIYDDLQYVDVAKLQDLETALNDYLEKLKKFEKSINNSGYTTIGE